MQRGLRMRSRLLARLGLYAIGAAGVVAFVKSQQFVASREAQLERDDQINSVAARANITYEKSLRRRRIIGLSVDPEMSVRLGATIGFDAIRGFDVALAKRLLSNAGISRVTDEEIRLANSSPDALWSRKVSSGYSGAEAAEFVYVRSGRCTSSDSVYRPWDPIASEFDARPSEAERAIGEACRWGQRTVHTMSPKEFHAWRRDSAKVEAQP